MVFHLHVSQKQKLLAIIAISFSFFVIEISVAFLTRSLALLADAFHYLNDLIGFLVALAAIIISERSDSPQDLSFGWQRARLLGAFFNGVFLLALGVSIFLQSIERFIYIEEIERPALVLTLGCIGLFLNIVSATILHEHHHHDDHAPDNILASTDPHTTRCQDSHHEHRHHAFSQPQGHHYDLGMMGVLLHVIGDALNNIGVIIAAIVIWQTSYPGRFYADPGVSMGIALMILLSALPLVKHSGAILLQSAPRGVGIDDVKHDLEKIPGIKSVHELHIWRLDQKKAIASAHVVVENDDIRSFMEQAKTVSECLHAYGIHSATLQPEISRVPSTTTVTEAEVGAHSDTIMVQAPAATTEPSTVRSGSLRRRRIEPLGCQIVCGNLCENLMCCTSMHKVQ